MKARNEQSTFRQRGFVCSCCDITVMVFGGDSAPTCCPCGCENYTMNVEWDHMVTIVTRVTAYVEPV